MVPFNMVKKDSRPLPPTPALPSHSKATENTQGYGPMDLGRKSGLKAECYNCKGFGHLSKDCPSKPLLGHVASIIPAPSDNLPTTGWAFEQVNLESETEKLGKGKAKTD